MKFLSTISNTATKPLSIRLNGMRFRMKSGEEKKSAEPTAAQVYSAQSWSAATAEAGTDIRPGTRPINTASQSGDAIKSTLTGSADAVLRSLPKKRLKTDSFLHSTASFLSKSPTSKPAKRQNRRLLIQPPLTPR